MSTNDSTKHKKWEGTTIQLMSLTLYPAGVLQMLSHRLIGIKALPLGIRQAQAAFTSQSDTGVFCQSLSCSFYDPTDCGAKALTGRLTA